MSNTVNSESFSPCSSWLGLLPCSDWDIDQSAATLFDKSPAALLELEEEPLIAEQCLLPTLEDDTDQGPADLSQNVSEKKETESSAATDTPPAPGDTHTCSSEMIRKMIQVRENKQVSLFFAHWSERQSRSKKLTIFPPPKPASQLGEEREITVVQEETLDSSSSSPESSFLSVSETNLHTSESPLLPESNK